MSSEGRMTMTGFIRVGIAAAAATAMTFAAQAADMRPVYKAAPRAAVYSWTGCYIGGQVGGQWGRWTGDVSYPGDAFGHAAVTASRDFDGDGAFIYGGQIGCNWQPVGGAFVLGVEGDVVGVSRGDVGGEIYRFPAPPTDHFNTTGKFGTQASLRLRGGFAFDRMLIYVGGGAEYLLTNSLSLGLEYRYTDYGSFAGNIPAGTAGTLSWAAFTVSADNLRTQDVRLRLNYLFNSAPVVARY